MAVADMKNIKPMTALDAEIGVGKKTVALRWLY
jgi:hypothetical protein